MIADERVFPNLDKIRLWWIERRDSKAADESTPCRVNASLRCQRQFDRAKLATPTGTASLTTYDGPPSTNIVGCMLRVGRRTINLGKCGRIVGLQNHHVKPQRLWLFCDRNRV